MGAPPPDDCNFELESILYTVPATIGDSKVPGTSHARHFHDIMEDSSVKKIFSQAQLSTGWTLLALTLLPMYCLAERVWISSGSVGSHGRCRGLWNSVMGSVFSALRRPEENLSISDKYHHRLTIVEDATTDDADYLDR
jgi:hypothetical protein